VAMGTGESEAFIRPLKMGRLPKGSAYKHSPEGTERQKGKRRKRLRASIKKVGNKIKPEKRERIGKEVISESSGGGQQKKREKLFTMERFPSTQKGATWSDLEKTDGRQGNTGKVSKNLFTSQK